MSGIFVSYRDDTAHSAGRLGSFLGARVGREHIFTADSIEVGASAVAATRDAVAACDILIAIIGPEWLASADDQGRRTIDQDDDLVAAEIATALQQKMVLVPVLVEGAEMPAAEDLPEKIRGLAQRQSVRLDHMTFRSDAAQLLGSVESALPKAMRPGSRPRSARRRSVRPSTRFPSGRPVPLSRAIRRVALWWATFTLAIPASVGLLSSLFILPPNRWE